ncbi:MAG: orotate phosphoribosyltransferase [Eubacterium sp.]|nr:orotate phosphoribosyltransferase [Eubacterium sp.]
MIPGHFATSHSHINYYMDMTAVKMRLSEASEIAKTLASEYKYSKYIDTIVCMDGCEIIGACLAEELTRNGIMSLNSHNSMYVVTPEIDSNGLMIFRDNIQPMVDGKNVLLLLASATTGRTIAKCLDCISYYNGIIQGISAIFSAAQEIHGYPVHSIFTPADLPDYQTFNQSECPHCQNKEKIDAIVNGFGYSRL